MLQSYWLALGVFALLMTVGWLFRPTERVTFTSLFAAAGWALMAITASDLERLTEGGDRVAAGLGLSPQLFLTALALLSMLAALLYRLDAYPPDEGLTEETNNGR
jgi:hypothetical protein